MLADFQASDTAVLLAVPPFVVSAFLSLSPFYMPPQSNPLADPIPNEQLVEELHQLLRAEKASINSVRESEWEVREILKTRIAQEQAITLKTPYFDIVRIKAEESDEEVRHSGAALKCQLFCFVFVAHRAGLCRVACTCYPHPASTSAADVCLA